MCGRVWRLHVCRKQKSQPGRSLASRSSPQGRQRGLGGEQDNKIKDLLQLFTSRTSNHMYGNEKANHFSLVFVTLFLPEAQQLCSKMFCICWQLEIHPSMVTKYRLFYFRKCTILGRWSFNFRCQEAFWTTAVTHLKQWVSHFKTNNVTGSLNISFAWHFVATELKRHRTWHLRHKYLTENK